MRKLVALGLISGGLVASAVVFGAATSLCVLNPAFSLDWGFPAKGGYRGLSLYERSVWSTVSFNEHAARLPVPLAKFVLLLLSILALAAIACLLRALLRLKSHGMPGSAAKIEPNAVRSGGDKPAETN